MKGESISFHCLNARSLLLFVSVFVVWSRTARRGRVSLLVCVSAAAVKTLYYSPDVTVCELWADNARQSERTHLPSTQTHTHTHTNHPSNASTLDNWVFSLCTADRNINTPSPKQPSVKPLTLYFPAYYLRVWQEEENSEYLTKRWSVLWLSCGSSNQWESMFASDKKQVERTGR